MAIWAAANSLLAIMLFRPAAVGEPAAAVRAGFLTATPTGCLVVGWAVIALAHLAYFSVSARRRKCEEEEGAGAGDGGVEWSRGVVRGGSGVVKRWWHIREVAAPREEMVAPRVRVSASKEVRELVESARWRRTVVGRMWALGRTVLSILCVGSDVEREGGAEGYAEMKEEELDGGVESVGREGEGRGVGLAGTRWEDVNELNLSYQV